MHREIKVNNNPTIRLALSVIQDAMTTDRAYAWSWHCNIAMSFFDAWEGPRPDNLHQLANEGAARFMETAFKINVREFAEWKDLEVQWAYRLEVPTSHDAVAESEHDDWAVTAYRMADALRSHLAVRPTPSVQPIRETYVMAANAYPKCTYVLAGNPNVAFPKTCKECGLGPCKRGLNTGTFEERVAAAALQSAQHVCGAQGFGALGDSCPCCKAQHNGCAGC